MAGENCLVTFLDDVDEVQIYCVKLLCEGFVEEEEEEAQEGEEQGQKASVRRAFEASVLDSARWFASSHALKTKMFFRPCYARLLELVKKHWSQETTKHVLLLGTPGTGKTYFLNYVAQILLSEDRDFNMIIVFGTLAMWVSSTGEHETMALQEGSIPLCFQKYLEQMDTVVLYDCSGQGLCQPPGMAKCKVLVTSSPDQSKYSDYQKHLSQTLYMPLWSFEELDLCRQECFPDIKRETLVKNFDLWGGVARYTIGEAAHNAESGIEDALARMNFSAAELVVRRWQALDVQGYTVSHRLVHAQTSDMYFISCQFASQYVCDRVFNSLALEEEEMCKKFLATNTHNIFAAMRGQFHESYCHRYLAQQKEITVRLLVDEDDKEDKNRPISLGEKNRLISLGERTLKRFDDLSELRNSHYGVPNAKNFAAVDSVALPNVVFSMTTSYTHPTVSSGLRKLMGKMAEQGGTLEYLVFVVPNHVAANFKKQNYWNISRKQYLKVLPAEIKGLQQAVWGVEYR
jgi:hypothetical protein